MTMQEHRPVLPLITTWALLTLKSSSRHVQHLAGPATGPAGHLTSALPECPARMDPQQQPGWTENKQHWHTAVALPMISCTETPLAVIRAEERSMGREGQAMSHSRGSGTPAQHSSKDTRSTQLLCLTCSSVALCKQSREHHHSYTSCTRQGAVRHASRCAKLSSLTATLSRNVSLKELLERISVFILSLLVLETNKHASA